MSEKINLADLAKRIEKLEATISTFGRHYLPTPVTWLDPASETKPQHKYKVGDWVKVVNATCDPTETQKKIVGEVFQISQIDNNDQTVYIDKRGWFNFSDIEPANAPVEKQKQEYWENGACKFPLENDQAYYIVDCDGEVLCQSYQDDSFDQYLLLTQEVFDTEEACEKWANVKKRHYEILQDIDKIHREEGWVCNFADYDQRKYFVCWDYSAEKIDWGINRYSFYSVVDMSEKAKDYVMSLSESDQKKFLKILKN
jgi:hypothetical protein